MTTYPCFNGSYSVITRPIPPDVAAQTAFNEVPTVAQLRMALKR